MVLLQQDPREQTASLLCITTGAFNHCCYCVLHRFPETCIHHHRSSTSHAFITFCVSLFSSLLFIIGLVKWVEGCSDNLLLLCSFSRSCQGRNSTSYQFQKIDVPCDFCMATRMNDMWGPRLCPWYSRLPRKAARDAQSSLRCLSTCSGSTSPAYVSSRRTRRCDPICLFHSPRTNSTPANWVKLYMVVALFQVPLVREKNYFSILGCNWMRCSTKPQPRHINFCLWRTVSRWPAQAYLSLVYLMYFFKYGC